MLIQPVGRKCLFPISDHKQKILTRQTFPYFAETLFPAIRFSLVHVQSRRCNLGQCLLLLHSRNLLSVLPKYLFNLPLKVLLVSNNKLLSIPEEIGKAKDLMELVRKRVVHKNAHVFLFYACAIPVVVQCRPLQDVSCNEIQALPAQVGRLQALRELNIRKNCLQMLPEGQSSSSLSPVPFLIFSSHATLC